MTGKTWLIFVAICAVILGGFYFYSQSSRINVDSIDILSIQAPSAQNGQIGDHLFGNKDAKVRIIEYGDYQCPGCKATAPVLKAVSTKYKDKVAFIFRNYPLPGHGNARAAAAAAEAAGLQGKFWEMHDTLYASQDDWENLDSKLRLDTFVSYAESLGVKRDTFVTDVDSKNVLAKINFDKALGTKAQVSSTPSIFVNGELVDQSVENGKLIDSDKGPFVWSSEADFENLVIIPALKKAGVKLDDK